MNHSKYFVLTRKMSVHSHSHSPKAGIDDGHSHSPRLSILLTGLESRRNVLVFLDG